MANPADIFTSVTEINRVPCLNRRENRIEARPKCYPIQKLPELIEVLRLKTEDPYTIRFLVDMGRNLWFAEEGLPSAHIPAHYQMTNEDNKVAGCIAAGNLSFSEDYKHIIALNNKSGDFHPDFDTIKWPLAILIANTTQLSTLGVDLPEAIKINSLSSQMTHTLEKTALTAWLNVTFGEAKMGLFQRQPTAIKITTYDPTPQREYSEDSGAEPYPKFPLFSRPSPAKPLTFFGDSPSSKSERDLSLSTMSPLTGDK